MIPAAPLGCALCCGHPFSSRESHAREQRLAFAPQPRRRSIVERGGRWRQGLAVVEIPPAALARLRRRRQPDHRARGLAGAYRIEGFHVSLQARIAMGREIAGDHPGMHDLGDDAVGRSAPCQFAREQDVGELGLTISTHGGEAAEHLQIIPNDARTVFVPCRGNTDDAHAALRAARCGCAQQGHQLARQQKGCEMVRGKGGFIALGGQHQCIAHAAGVVDQHIETRRCRGDLRRDPHHLTHQREISANEMHRSTSGRRAPDLGLGCRAAPGVAADSDDSPAPCGERLGGGQADARARAADDRYSLLFVHLTGVLIPARHPACACVARRTVRLSSAGTTRGRRIRRRSARARRADNPHRRRTARGECPRAF